MLLTLLPLLRVTESASAEVQSFRKPFMVKSGDALPQPGAAAFLSSAKCGEPATFTTQSAGNKLRLQLVVPATADRNWDDRWSMDIATAGGHVVHRSSPRWCKQPEDDELDIVTLVATRTVHRWNIPGNYAWNKAWNIDNYWNSSVVQDFVVTVTYSCNSVLPNGTLSTNGQELPSWMQDSTWISAPDPTVASFGLWLGDIADESQVLDSFLELTVLTPITIEQAQFWGHVFFLPWTLIPAMILANLILILQAVVKAVRRCLDPDGDGDGCVENTFIWPMDPPLYFWFAINAQSFMIAIAVNRMLCALIAIAFVPAINNDDASIIVILLWHFLYPGVFIGSIFVVGMIQPCCCCACVKPPRDDADDSDSFARLQLVLWIIQAIAYVTIAILLGALGIGYFAAPALVLCSAVCVALQPLWQKLCARSATDSQPMTQHEIQMMKLQAAKRMGKAGDGTGDSKLLFKSDTGNASGETLPDYTSALRQGTKPVKIKEGEDVI